MQENTSEIARLMQQITQEYEAAQRALHGLAFGTSKHRFITARLENIGRCQQELQQLVGEQEAVKMVAETLEQAGNEGN